MSRELLNVLKKDSPGILFAEFTSLFKKNDLFDIYSFDDNLYHYTNIDGLKGIIESNSLWLSEARYLNDKEELIDGKNKVIEVIQFLLKNKSKYKVFENVLNTIINKLNNTTYSNKYICSFSVKRDDLDQWRAYGSNGSGICIELTRNKESNSLFEIFNFWNFNKVIYDDKKKYRIIHRLIFKYFYYYLRDFKIKHKFLDDKDFIESLSSRLIYNFVLFKNKCFESEQEIRLVYSGDPILKDFKTKYFRNTNNVLVPYIRTIDALIKDEDKRILSEKQKLPITEILVGPTVNQDLTLESIKEFIQFNGYSKDIVNQSTIPYR